MATVKTILDRMDLINQSVNSVQAVRYFPTNIDELAPFALPVPKDATYLREPGTERVMVTRDFQTMIVVAALTEAIIVEDAQTLLEQVLEDVIDAYLSRPRLEQHDAGLDGVTVHTVIDDTIEPQDFYDTEFLVVIVSHEVEYRKTITYNTS